MEILRKLFPKEANKEFAMDLGASNIRIMCNGVFILDELSVVEIDIKNGKCRHIGYETQVIYEEKRVPKRIKPILCGDYNTAGLMVKEFISRVSSKLFNRLLHRKILVAVSLNVDEELLQVVEYSLRQCGFAEVRFIYGVVAAYLACCADYRPSK